jgi:hypothetical protein
MVVGAAEKNPFNLPMILRPGVVVPFLLLVAYIALPEDLRIFAAVGLFLFHLHFCIGLTFDGFTRFSRYRLSQKHPVLDKIISISFIIFCFVGFSPIALLMESYSFLVSPDEPEVQKRPIYNRPFIKPLLQAVILLTAVIVAVFRSNA